MFRFEIYGPPVPQKQTRFSCAGGKPRTWDPSKEDKEKIQWQVKPYAPPVPLEGAIELTIVFYLPIPKSTSGVKRKQMLNHVILPTVKPDEDNLAYIVTNALKKLVYHDDSQIVSKHVYKLYGTEPKTVIKVREIMQMEQVGLHVHDL